MATSDERLKNKGGRPPEEPLILDMPFAEAMERLAGVDPAELREEINKWKKRRARLKKARLASANVVDIHKLAKRRRGG